ncbi:SH2 domain-containing protein 1A-like [Saccoglossus kowalevskii]
MSTMSWYHGQLSRMKAEELLMSSGKDGSFLVRESESMKGAYALCVLCQGRIHQYRVLPSPDEAGLTTYIIKAVQGVQQHKYCTLDDLIKGYEHDNNGLACGLKYPVGKDEEAEDDSDDEGTILIAATSKQFSSRYSQLQFSGTDRVFEDSIKNYISNGLLKDIERVQCGATSTPHLRRLLSKSAKEFQQ